MDLLSGSLGVVAVTEIAKRIYAKDWRGVVIIVGALAIGAGAGYLGVAHLTVVTGLIAGADAVGLHTVGSAAGGK